MQAEKRAKWEEISRLGEGGQSEVFLVRSPARMAERRNHLQKLMDLSNQGFNEVRARQFAQAAFEYARDERPFELGALKKFNPRASGPEAEHHALERLKSEITVLSQHRPGLLKLLDSDEPERWIVTEYCAGGTLEGHPSTYAGNAWLALVVFRSLVETVAGLHKENIVHRDVKPANVFIDNGGRMILGDFGIVYLPNLPERPTLTNESVGPRDYMPPWADLGQRTEKIEPNFDVYMLGKLLWCMVAGRLKLTREWHRKPEFDLTLKYKCDPRMHMINAILDKCLVEDPEKCLPSAQELLLVVDDALGIMGRGGQMLRDDVPRPCHVCGKGLYQPEPLHEKKARLLSLWLSGNETVSLAVKLSVCDYCGHVDFFKPALN
jgi:serine/threonine protein kinase